ncbi:TAXI family TRAP transporter solute-binding subunit [Anaerotruncus rubiinfantis]|uniref:TAXI family TRAP transporter solute-binding subunit n=1 Tax=Anaerotruncus rubiinfantis TaxID=1720200 RepID=UPI0011C7FF8F|nr:TAXI family TRAP transporter solute-binding subunit [Anaerotruncus rubiinfantis]
MKKGIFTVVMAIMVILAGCSSAPSTASSTTAGNEAAPPAKSGGVELSMATGGTSGTYYGYSGIMAQVLNEKIGDKLHISVESSGGSKANIQLVESGASQLAIVQNDVMYYAYSGTDMFEGTNPATSFSAVASCYPEVVHIASKKDITSIDELKDKNVSVSEAGSGTEFNARQILDIYGMTFDDIKVSHMSVGDSLDALKNGTIDACFFVGGYPVVGASELAATYDYNLLSIDDEHAKLLEEKYSFYSTITIPADTYKPVTEDVQTVAVMATIIARNDVSEDAVYELTKGMFENQTAIASGHAKGELLSLDTALNGISIPFHPGAEKYYKEAGVV